MIYAKSLLIALAIFHLLLDLSLGKTAHMFMSLLIWAAIGLLSFEKLETLIDPRTKWSRWLGIVVLSSLIAVSIFRPGERLIGFFPLVAFLGWILCISGVSKLPSLAKELAILSIFGAPKLIPNTALPLESITAHFATYLLWYFGHSVHLSGKIISVPNGSVEVVPSCSGLDLMTHMLSVSVIFLAIFSVRRSQMLVLPLLAILVGFVVNGLRVALLALLSPPQFSEAFKYWHSSSGASLFVIAAIAVYGLLCYAMLRWPTRPKYSAS